MKIACEHCELENDARLSSSGKAILPRGWRRFAGFVWCAKCWTDNYYITAITMSVLKPIGDRSWSDLRKALKASWAQSTSLANWAMTELAKRDVVRTPTDPKMPKMPLANLYQEARVQYPTMPTGSLSGVLQTVQRLYLADRYEVVWTGARSLRSFRYPRPFPVRAQDWKPLIGAEGEPIVRCRLNGESWQLQLRRGKQWARQYGAFKRIAQGESPYVEMSLLERRVSNGAHGNGGRTKEPGGGQSSATRVLCKMVIWLRKPGRKESERIKETLQVATSNESFLTASLNGTIWLWNADHVRRWIAEHARRYGRMAEDRKFEFRVPKRRGRQLQDHLDKRTTKYRNRLDTFIKQTIAALIGYAERKKVAGIRWDDMNRSYLPTFPYYRLTEAMRVACDRRSLTFERVEKDDKAKQAPAEPSAQGDGAQAAS